MRRILVTGGAGFIGTEIVKKLSKNKNNQITVLDIMSPQIHGNDYEQSYLYNTIKDKCHFIKGDVCDYEVMYSAVKNADYIIHLAAETGTGQSMYQINNYNNTNIMGTSNLLQVISSLGKECEVKKIVLSSSRSVYGEGKYECPNCGVVYPKARDRGRMLAKDFALYCATCGERLKLVPTTEDSVCRPSSLYAFTKLSQEMMLQTMCPALGIDYTIFRFQNVYGVGQSLKNPYTGILSVFSTLMLENKPVNIFEDGKESRDFINVMDVADAVIKSLDVPESNGEIMNLGSGVNTSVIEIAEILKKSYESTSEINISGDFRLGDIAHNKADIEKAKNILGFTAKVPLEEGLNDFCKWVQGEQRDNSGYEKSLKEMEMAGLLLHAK